MDAKKTLDANGGALLTRVVMNRKRKSALLQKIRKTKLLVNRDTTSWHRKLLVLCSLMLSEHTHINARIVCLLSVLCAEDGRGTMTEMQNKPPSQKTNRVLWSFQPEGETGGGTQFGKSKVGKISASTGGGTCELSVMSWDARTWECFHRVRTCSWWLLACRCYSHLARSFVVLCT